MQQNTNLKTQENIEQKFSSLDIKYEEEHALAWYRMNAHPRPCFTPNIIAEMLDWFDEIIRKPENSSIKYLVMGSNTPNIFCLGGDLKLFLHFIKNNQREKLYQYDVECLKAVYQMYTGLGKGLTTIALVQGDALGGGLEGALANDVIIAEKSAKMGLPDILFNLFPGAGAYNFLSKKVGFLQAEKMVLGGKLYTAQEMFDLGVVDILVEDGEGEAAVYNYIKKENRQRNGIKAFKEAKRIINNVSFEELLDAAQIWADAAMSLGDKDLRMMERLVRRQSALVAR